jgi:aerobic C4-dicarboxylate transport protein
MRRILHFTSTVQRQTISPDRAWHGASLASVHESAAIVLDERDAYGASPEEPSMDTVANGAPRAKAPIYKALYFQVLCGLALGIAVGHFWPEFGASLKPLGDAFVKLVKMMIAPVVFCTIALGICSLNDSKEIGKTLLKAMALFYVLTILALIVGLSAVLIMQPGAGMNIDPATLDPEVAKRFTNNAAPKGFVEFMMHIIPASFFGAFAEGEVLPVLLLAVLSGFGLARIGGAGKAAVEALEAFSHMLFATFGFIMKLAPVGAFGAMAFTVGRYGIKSIGSLGHLILTFYVACGFFVVVVLGLLARMHGFSL